MSTTDSSLEAPMSMAVLRMKYSSSSKTIHSAIQMDNFNLSQNIMKNLINDICFHTYPFYVR